VSKPSTLLADKTTERNLNASSISTDQLPNLACRDDSGGGCHGELQQRTIPLSNSLGDEREGRGSEECAVQPPSSLLSSQTQRGDRERPLRYELLVDAENANELILDSEDRLTDLVRQLSVGASRIGDETEPEVLASHCRRQTQSRYNDVDVTSVMCYGISQRSTATLHTWPTKGAFALEVSFVLKSSASSSSASFRHIQLEKSVSRIFGVLNRVLDADNDVSSSHLPLRMRWKYKKRARKLVEIAGLGIDDAEDAPHACAADTFASSVLRNLELSKEDIASLEFEFGKSDAWYTRVPSETSTDIGTQVRSSAGEAAYYEALVHPAMFSFQGPQSVSESSSRWGAY